MEGKSTELSGGQRYAQLIIIALTTVSYPSPMFVYKVAHCAISDHGTATIRAIVYVHHGRDRRNNGPLTHAIHWHALPQTVPRGVIHHRLSERGTVHEGERTRFRDGTGVIKQTGQRSNSLSNHYERKRRRVRLVERQWLLVGQTVGRVGHHGP
jgi:hypothetical protein